MASAWRATLGRRIIVSSRPESPRRLTTPSGRLLAPKLPASSPSGPSDPHLPGETFRLGNGCCCCSRWIWWCSRWSGWSTPALAAVGARWSYGRRRCLWSARSWSGSSQSPRPCRSRGPIDWIALSFVGLSENPDAMLEVPRERPDTGGLIRRPSEPGGTTGRRGRLPRPRRCRCG